jgi:NADH-quinone oxidoreductase subunit F
MKPIEVTDVVKNSGLRGRGGAGFPTGMKWAFIDNKNWPHYVVANADESEPGTFKDREIMEGNPFQFLEGVAMCLLRGRRERRLRLPARRVLAAGRLPRRKDRRNGRGGLPGQETSSARTTRLKSSPTSGAGAYICGEETALLESLEGKRGQPRVRPPFPPVVRLVRQADHRQQRGDPHQRPAHPVERRGLVQGHGHRRQRRGEDLLALGRVRKPGNYELPFGTTFRELIYTHGGGVQDSHKVKAIMPAGASSSLILVDDDKILDTPMDYENRSAPSAATSVPPPSSWWTKPSRSTG